MALRLSALITTALIGSRIEPKARNISSSVAPTSRPIISGSRSRDRLEAVDVAGGGAADQELGAGRGAQRADVVDDLAGRGAERVGARSVRR